MKQGGMVFIFLIEKEMIVDGFRNKISQNGM